MPPCITPLMPGPLRMFAVALLILFSLTAAAQDQQDKPEVPQKQTNPATQSNLPNAPSSVITGKPHNQGQIPLELLPHPTVKLMRLPLNILGDQYRIFTSPLYIRVGDLKWLVPMAGAAAASFSQDTHVNRDVVSHQPGFNNTAANLSDGVRDGFIGVPVILWAAGSATHNERASETGLLSGEAMVDAYIVDAVVKAASFRERPTAATNYRGNFYDTGAGLNSSFISGHAMVSWSSAAVMAAEYPRTWQQLVIYTAATSVSVNRVLAEQHFPTDVLLGSAGGWLIGHYVVRAHHHLPIFKRQAVAQASAKDVADSIRLAQLAQSERRTGQANPAPDRQ